MNHEQKKGNLISPSKWPFYYGWMILAAGALGVLMSAPGQTIGVSAFTDPLLEALSLSRDQLSFSYMAGTMLSAALLTRAGIYFDKFGAMKTALISSIGLGIALIYLSQADKISNLIGAGSLITMSIIFIGFVFIRFFGQGVLTLASRTMVVKWFGRRRGLAVGIMSVVAAFGFSIAPMFFDRLIENFGWSMAWLIIAIVCGLAFPIVIFFFFKKGPEEYGLNQDGADANGREDQKQTRFPVYHDYNLKEARNTLSLWIFAGLPALYGLVITGFTFHIVSIFEQQSMSKDLAINIFQPIAFVAVGLTALCSWISDYVKLKYIAYLFGLAGMMCMYSVVALESVDIHYWILIGSFGVCSGIHPLILTLFLPRFFGKKYLGAITGQAMTLVVLASALGPILFSQSLTLMGSYDLAAYICGTVFALLTILAFFTKNPQLEYSKMNIQ